MVSKMSRLLAGVTLKLSPAAGAGTGDVARAVQHLVLVGSGEADAEGLPVPAVAAIAGDVGQHAVAGVAGRRAAIDKAIASGDAHEYLAAGQRIAHTTLPLILANGGSPTLVPPNT
ncbi:hypothetical protein G6F46_014447 [Rhizopus delemar]|nr:hypothetical protein G6F46_014447 [Rhizopus delemar]